MVAIHLSTIQRYSTKDGPGIRSTVFLIGCNLRCAWCSNPELMLPYNKLLHFSSLCRGCQSCVHAYPTAVYMEDGAIHMHPCAQHMAGELEEVCPFDALEQVGMQVECQQLVKQLEKDFRNAAYATIRTFVMKFHEMGLLTARKAGNRVFYHVGGTSDGRPNESKRRTL